MSAICHKIIWKWGLDGGKDEINSHDGVAAEARCWTQSTCALLLLLLLNRFSRVRLCATPETVAHQALPFLGFSRQEHWSRLPFPSPMNESEKAGLNFNIQKTKIMAFGPITSWQIDGETVEALIDFIFLGSKVTADGDCSHEIKICLLLGRKVMNN